MIVQDLSQVHYHYQINNLTEEIYKIKCENCDYFPEYKNDKDNLIKHKCPFCNKTYSNKIDEELKNNSRTRLSFPIMILIN